jgi:hypothetical protein
VLIVVLGRPAFDLDLAPPLGNDVRDCGAILLARSGSLDAIEEGGADSSRSGAQRLEVVAMDDPALLTVVGFDAHVATVAGTIGVGRIGSDCARRLMQPPQLGYIDGVVRHE